MSSDEQVAAIQSVLDDGQEIKAFKLFGIGAGYCVTIHGDCVCESRSKPTIGGAIAEASSKYQAWLKEVE